MNYFQIVKEKLLLWYFWSSQIFLGLNALLYIACCFVGGGLVGPISYIGFLYHCCQWKVS